jgi:excisionase family DNA binding protein
MAEYLNFDEVMKELEVTDDELRRMVSEGELRAFRSENKMKFRKEDVAGLKKGKEREPTILLPTEGAEEAPAEELELELEPEGEAAAAEEAPVELEESEAAPAAEEAPVELDLDEAEAAPAELELEPAAEVSEEPVVEEATADETFVDAEEEAVPTLEAEPSADDSGLDDLTLSEETVAEAEETATEDDLDTASTTAPLAFADEGGGGAGEESTGEGGGGAATAPRGRRAPAMAAAGPAAAPKAHWMWTLLLFLGFVPTVILALLLADDYMIRAGHSDRPNSTTDWLYDMIGQKVWEDAAWKNRIQKGAPAGTFGDVSQTQAELQKGPGGKKLYMRSYDAFGSYKLPDTHLPEPTK